MKPTIPQTIFEAADTFPNKKILYYKKGGSYVGITFKELRKQVYFFSSALLGLGIEKGDRVGILSSNHPEWVIADLAIMHIGAIVVPVHVSLSPRLIQHILLDSGARILIVNNQLQLNKVLLIEKNLPDLKKIIYMDIDNPDTPSSKALISWEEMISNGKKQNLKPKQEGRHTDIATIVYTSGTTDTPKGVMLSHYNILSNVRAALDYVSVTPKDILLSFLPLSHILERTAGYYAPISQGASIAYAENTKTLPKNIKEIRPTILVSVPRIFEKMFDAIWEKVKRKKYLKNFFVWALNQEKGTWKHFFADIIVYRKIRNLLGGRLRFTISGGASLNPKLARFYEKIGIIILEGYGLTEASPVVSVNTLEKKKFGSVGLPLIGIDVKIAQDKEILVKGPNVMQGYFHNEQATKEIIDEYGWLHTGDLGFIDNEGFLFVIGRRKEMIVLSTGKNVWPEVVENALNSDRFILQSIVFGNNQKYLTALIVPDLQELQEFTRENHIVYNDLDELLEKEEIQKLYQERIARATKHLSDHEKVVRFHLLKNEFQQKKDELTPTLKLRREIIAEKYKTIIQKMYEQ